MSESDVHRRQIQTYEDGPRAEWVKRCLRGVKGYLLRYSNIWFVTGRLSIQIEIYGEAKVQTHAPQKVIS